MGRPEVPHSLLYLCAFCRMWQPAVGLRDRVFVKMSVRNVTKVCSKAPESSIRHLLFFMILSPATRYFYHKQREYTPVVLFAGLAVVTQCKISIPTASTTITDSTNKKSKKKTFPPSFEFTIKNSKTNKVQAVNAESQTCQQTSCYQALGLVPPNQAPI